MKDRCELSYNKKYTNATFCCKISDVTQIYDAAAFAKWLTDAFNESRFKSWEEVAKAVGSTRSTLSRYAGAKEQALTGKPSQPKPDLVIKLAEVFGKDVDEALTKAGHAPLTLATDFDEKVRVAFHGADEWTEDEKQRALDFVRTFVAGVRAKRREEEEQQKKGQGN